MTRKRVFFLFSIGLGLGIGLGLLLGWIVWPVSYGVASPALLQDVYREDVAVMVAARYMTDGDLVVARQTLLRLGEDWEMVLASAETRAQAADRANLTQLAVDLGLSAELPTPTAAPFSSATEEGVNE